MLDLRYDRTVFLALPQNAVLQEDDSNERAGRGQPLVLTHKRWSAFQAPERARYRSTCRPSGPWRKIFGGVQVRSTTVEGVPLTGSLD